MKPFAGHVGDHDGGLPWGRLLDASMVLAKVGLVIAIGYLTARLIWLIVAGVGQDVTITSSSQGGAGVQSSIAADPIILQQVDLFAVTSTEQVAAPSGDQTQFQILDAPTTNLKLTLHGLRYSDSGVPSVAVISYENGAQENYRVGNDIKGLSGVKIDSIYEDGVLIVRNGKVESLFVRDTSQPRLVQPVDEPADSNEGRARTPDIPQRQASSQLPSGAAAAGVAQSEPAQPEQTSPRVVAEYEEAEILQLMQSLNLNINATEDGVLIMPTRNGHLFSRAQLRSRDILVKVGGMRVDDNTDFERLLRDVENDDEIDLEVVRGNELRLVTIRRRN